MIRHRRVHPSTPSRATSPYDLSDPDGEPPEPDRAPRLTAWLGLSGAILAIVAMFLPWAAGSRGAGWDVPMVLLATPLFFAPAVMLTGALAIGVACGRVTRGDPLYGVPPTPASMVSSLAAVGAIVLGLRGCGLIVNIVREGFAHTGIGGYCFLIAAILAVTGVVGMNRNRR